MAKKWLIDRSTDSSFRKLSSESKLIIYYLIGKVDHAGFGDYDHEMIDFIHGFQPGTTESKEAEISCYVVLSDNKKKYWFGKHIEEQANLPLCKKNNCHKGIVIAIRQNLHYFNSSKSKILCLPAETHDGLAVTVNDIISE